MLADTTPAAVGTSGTVGANESRGGTVTVDRARLMQVRQQLDALLATLNRPCTCQNLAVCRPAP